jgi:hypothetical protein
MGGAYKVEYKAIMLIYIQDCVTESIILIDGFLRHKRVVILIATKQQRNSNRKISHRFYCESRSDFHPTHCMAVLFLASLRAWHTLSK